MLNDKIFFMQAFQSKDYNNVENYDYQCILEFYTHIITKKIGEIPNDIRFLLEMYCHGSITMTVDWALSEVKMSPEEIADLLISALSERLKELISDL